MNTIFLIIILLLFYCYYSVSVLILFKNHYHSIISSIVTITLILCFLLSTVVPPAQCLPGLWARGPSQRGHVPQGGREGGDGRGGWHTWVMRNLVRRSGSRPFSLERISSSMSPCSFSITTNTFSGVSNMHSRFTIPGCRRLWGGVWGGAGQGPGHP